MQFYLLQFLPVLCKNKQGILLSQVKLLFKQGIGEMASQRFKGLLFFFKKSQVANTFAGRSYYNITKGTFGKTVIDG